MNTIHCITDSDELRYPAEAQEEESNLTDLENRISWGCDEWADALENDTYDEWKSVRMALYGATQTLVHCRDRYDDRKDVGRNKMLNN